MTCRTCAKDVPDSSRFCLSCGAALHGNAPLATQTFATPSPTPTPARTPSHSRLRSSSGSLGEGRFLPGAPVFHPPERPAIEWPTQIILYAALAAGALRFGLVALVAALFTANMLLDVAVTLNPSAWYFTNAGLALASFAALVIWGFSIALAGQTPWKAES